MLHSISGRDRAARGWHPQKIAEYNLPQLPVSRQSRCGKTTQPLQVLRFWRRLVDDIPDGALRGFVAAGESGDAVAGAWIIHRFVGTPFTLNHLKSMFGLMTISAQFSTMLRATIGAAAVAMALGHGTCVNPFRFPTECVRNGRKTLSISANIAAIPSFV